MNTVKMWIELIPDKKIREDAINLIMYPNATALSIGDALSKFCDWGETPQGYEYWEKIYTSFLTPTTSNNETK